MVTDPSEFTVARFGIYWFIFSVLAAPDFGTAIRGADWRRSSTSSEYQICPCRLIAV
jgi:hypothetical protein